MITANVASAKNGLSKLLRHVSRGESVLITDRKRPVAYLKPISSVSHPESLSLESLHASGVLLPPSGQALDAKAFLALPKAALKGSSSLVAAILAEREEGR